jgi:hypothetical protein
VVFKALSEAGAYALVWLKQMAENKSPGQHGEAH